MILWAKGSPSSTCFLRTVLSHNGLCRALVARKDFCVEARTLQLPDGYLRLINNLLSSPYRDGGIGLTRAITELLDQGEKPFEKKWIGRRRCEEI